MTSETPERAHQRRIAQTIINNMMLVLGDKTCAREVKQRARQRLKQVRDAEAKRAQG